MQTKKIDLYEYFGVKRPENGSGYLTTYIHDVSRAVNIDRKSPAMLVIPGGGYAMVSFREDEPVALKYLSYGYNSFVLNYSVAPVKYPYAILEAVMAMEYVRKNADELKTDRNMVAAVGFSAGGHLAAMLGSVNACDEWKAYFKPEYDPTPNATVLSYPVITSEKNTAHMGSFDNLCGLDNEELKKKTDILNLINEKSAPAFIWSTNNDGVVPCGNALLAALKYDEKKVPFSIHVFGKGQHGFSCGDMTVYNSDEPIKAASKSISEWIRLSVEWLEEIGIYIK